MKIWNTERYYYVFKTCVRQKTTPKRYQKLEFQTLRDTTGTPTTLCNSLVEWVGVGRSGSEWVGVGRSGLEWVGEYQ